MQQCNKGSIKFQMTKDIKLKIMISNRKKQSRKPMRHSHRNSYIMIFFSLPSFQRCWKKYKASRKFIRMAASLET